MAISARVAWASDGRFLFPGGRWEVGGRIPSGAGRWPTGSVSRTCQWPRTPSWSWRRCPMGGWSLRPGSPLGHPGQRRGRAAVRGRTDRRFPRSARSIAGFGRWPPGAVRVWFGRPGPLRLRSDHGQSRSGRSRPARGPHGSARAPDRAVGGHRQTHAQRQTAPAGAV